MQLIDSLDTIKTQLGVTGTADDALLESIQPAVDDAIFLYCGRRFDGGTFTEFADGGAKMIVLANYPVEEGWELRIDPGRYFMSDSIVPAERVVVNTERGIVTLASRQLFVMGSGPYGYPRSVKFTYSTPTSAVPESVKRASIEWIGHWYRQAKTWAATNQQNVRTKTDGTVITEYPWGQSGGYPIPMIVRKLLDPFRTPNV